MGLCRKFQNCGALGCSGSDFETFAQALALRHALEALAPALAILAYDLAFMSSFAFAK